MSDAKGTKETNLYMELLDRHSLIEEIGVGSDPLREFSEWNDSVSHSALLPIALQNLARLTMQFEHVINQSGAPHEDDDLTLMLSFFIYGRIAGEGAQMVVNGATFGDPDENLTDVRIEPNARRGDFDIDLLIAVKQLGPNPDYVEGSDLPLSRTAVREAALLKEMTGDNYADSTLRRRALKALGLTPIIYDADEIARDPMALARRVVDDLVRATVDDIYPI